MNNDPQVTRLTPFSFEPNLKTVLWGGEKIAALKGVRAGNRHVGESWEVSGLRGKESIVATGADAGLNLRELIDKYRGALVGQHIYDRYGNEFPLLVKFIDAKRDLSVQVHPGEELARRRHGCSGKSEFWYIMQADEGASLLAGMSRAISRADYNGHVTRGTITSVMQRHATRPGDAFFLPAGCLHSIGAGNLLCEVQQSSDITYRVHDFDRRDANGEPRQLHTTLAADAIDFALTANVRCEQAHALSERVTLLSEPCFTVAVLRPSGLPVEMPRANDTFVVATCLEGDVTLEGEGYTMPLHRGHSVLVAACSPVNTVTGSGTLLVSSL